MRIDPETGQIFDRVEEKGGAVVETAPPIAVLETKSLIKGAMDGTLPLPRPLRTDEVLKFSATHVCMVLDMSAGAKNPEIAEKYGVEPGMISNLRWHPWTQLILQSIFSKLADNLTDPIERIKAYANEAIDVKVDILRDPKKPASLRNVVASDILDRAGYGSKRKLDIEFPQIPQPSVPQGQIGRIAAALESSAKVREAEWARFTTRPAPQEDGVVAVKEPSSEDSASSDDSGASHAGPPQPELQVRVA